MLVVAAAAVVKRLAAVAVAAAGVGVEVGDHEMQLQLGGVDAAPTLNTVVAESLIRPVVAVM